MSKNAPERDKRVVLTLSQPADHENFLKLLFISAYFMRQKNMPQKYLTGRSRVAAFMLY